MLLLFDTHTQKNDYLRRRRRSSSSSSTIFIFLNENSKQ